MEVDLYLISGSMRGNMEDKKISCQFYLIIYTFGFHENVTFSIFTLLLSFAYRSFLIF